jgi:hypothetical protein
MKANNDFLPQGYEQPVSGGNYMKLKQGENKFRILSKPIIGWLDWKDKKPLRFRMKDKPKAPIDAAKPIKHFWAMVVWNYNDSQVQVFEITQSSIQTAVSALSNDSDWGSPLTYDIKIIRTGEKMETQYTVNPSPHKPLSNEIKEAYQTKRINLEALYEGADPFASQEEKSFTNDTIDAF